MRPVADAAVAALLALAVLVTGGPAAEQLEDLLFDFQLIPLDGQMPPPMALEGLDGKTVNLADLRGRVALLYFWATS